MVTKFLLYVSARELDNSLVSDPNDGGLKEARDEEDGIVINYSTLRTFFPLQQKNYQQDKSLRVVVNFSYLLLVYIPKLSKKVW